MISFLKRRRRFIIIFLILLVVILGGKQLFFSEKKSEESTIVRRGDVREELTLSGEIDVEEKASLKFQTAGLLSWVGVKEGDRINKYQTIASLDQRQIKKTLEKYLNTFLKTRQDFDQTIADNPDAAIYTDKVKRIVEKSQNDLDNAVRDVEIQTVSLELANLWTPIDGIVTRVDTPFPGVNVTSTQTPFEVVNPNTVFLQVTADQTEVIHLNEGKVGTITLDSYPSEELKGSITYISFTPKENESGTVYKIKIAFNSINNPDYKYKAGMTGDITFVLSQKKNVLYLPQRFIKSDDHGKYVLKGKAMKKTYIETGLEGEDKIEIKGNVTENDIVYD